MDQLTGELVISAILAFAVVLTGLIVETYDARAESEIRAPFPTLFVGAISLGMGLFCILDGLHQDALSRRDGWAWIALILGFGSGGVILALGFLRFRVRTMSDGVIVRGLLRKS